MSKETTVLQVNDLSIGYGRNSVLQNVSFKVLEGEVLAVIGQNGSGKSTLLKSLTGMLPLRKGSVKYNGYRVNSLNPHSLVKQGISFFLQGGLIVPSLTVNEHLVLTACQRGKTMKNGMNERVYEQFPKLKPLANKRAGNLSGGERQILSFAILNVQESKIWFLDEPTAGLSPEMVRFTSDYLNKKRQEDNITMLLVEHNMEIAFHLASHLIIAKNGTVSRKFEKQEFLSKNFLDENVYN